MAVIENFRTLTNALVERYQWMRQAGISFGGARDMYTTLGYDRDISAKQYRDEYARGGIASRIVEAYPKATWRGGVELYEDEDPKVSTAFEEAWEAIETRLGVWSILQRADILAGLSTYSVILLGAPGSFDEELPKGKPDQLLYLTPFAGGGGGPNLSAVGASNFVDATIQSFDIDAASPRFGLPLTYQLRRMDITSPELMKPVHWSRIIHVAEGCLDNEVYGIPVLESIWNYLMDLTKVAGGGAEAFWLRANQGINLNLDKDVELGVDAAAKLKDEVDEYRHNISRVLKTRGMDVNVLGSDVANFSNPVDSIVTLIAGTKGIPKRILMGSEMGQLASGQDADNWATQVQDRRTGYAGPRIVRPFVDRLIKYGYLPTPKKDYEVGWPVVESLKEAEKSSGAAAWASVNASYGGIVFTDAEIREHFYGLEPLSEEDKAAAAPAPPPAAPVDPNADPSLDPNAPEAQAVSKEGTDGAVPDTSVEGILDALLTDAEEFRAAGGPGSGQQGHETPGDAPAPAPVAIPQNWVQALNKAMTGNGIGSFKKTATEVAAALEHKNSQAAQKTTRVAGRKLLAAGFVQQKDGSFLHKDGRKASIATSKDFKVKVAVSKKPVKVPEAKVDEPAAAPKKAAPIKEAGPELRKKAIAKMKSAEDAREYSSTQIQLLGTPAKKLLAFAASIPDEDLAEGGREDDPHVTVKYGLHTNDVADVRRVLSQVDGPIELILGEVSYFTAEDHDVLYVEVDSPDLVKLNATLSSNLEVTDTHEDYTPHATIAYLKPGLAAQYEGNDEFEGLTIGSSRITFSPKDGEKVGVDLGLHAAEEVEMLRVLTAAIECDNESVISAIIGVTHRAAGGPGSGPQKGDGSDSSKEDKKIAKAAAKELLDSAEKAGLSIYGPPNTDQTESGGSGLIFSREDNTVELINIDSVIPEDTNEDDIDDTGGATFYETDDFEYQFFPSTNEGRDVSGERVRSLKPDEDGKIYLYAANYGIRIIDTTNKSEEIRTLGGPGSGNFGHSGRPGAVGGSGGGGGGFSVELGGRLKAEKAEWQKETAGKVDPKTGEQMKFVSWKAMKRREEKAASKKDGWGDTASKSKSDAEDKHFDDFNKEEDKKSKYQESDKQRKADEEFDKNLDAAVKAKEAEIKARNKTAGIGLEKSLDISESQIKDFRKEQLHILDEDGRVLFNIAGTKSKVRIWDRAAQAAMNDPKARVTMIHNHPEECSLSAGDISCAALPGVKSIIAVTRQGSRFEAKVLRSYNAKGESNRAKRAAHAAIVRTPYSYGSDLYRSIGHLINLSLHERGVIDYKFKLSKEMKTALEREPLVPAMKAALGLK